MLRYVLIYQDTFILVWMSSDLLGYVQVWSDVFDYDLKMILLKSNYLQLLPVDFSHCAMCK